MSPNPALSSAEALRRIDAGRVGASAGSARGARYDRSPWVWVPGSEGSCVAGWGLVGERLRSAVGASGRRKTVVVVDCYPGVDEAEVGAALTETLKPVLVVAASDAFRSEAAIERLCEPFLGGGDPVFGFLSGLTMTSFFEPERVDGLRSQVEGVVDGVVLVMGVGAAWIHAGDLLVYADLARWEIQQRQRRGEVANLGVGNHGQTAGLKYKRAFFVDWRVADRWKVPLLERADYLLDTNRRGEPRLAEGGWVRDGLARAARRPFRTVPFFDPGVWGGQWMKRVCGLDPSAVNYAWCFDGVPEENSLVLGWGSERFELPALDLVLREARPLLGEAVHARFGTEFPIRFDLLDTMDGGPLSLQVHPLTEYIQSRFGMHYTQDESYYLLDAGPDASVYLGLQDGVDAGRMLRDLHQAQAEGAAFPVERHVRRWPAKRHDHFLIPAGTVHCSGRNSLVLEISATPYIFTFKMWDWGRLDLNGKPRPIHLDHAAANIQWDRTASWVGARLINQVTPVGQGDGWREERTGLHAREFIETRRHWFTRTAPFDTGGAELGSVNVLNLVEGEQAVVESPDGTFEPFVVHFAETFIVPASVGRYTLRPADGDGGREMGVMRAYVRTGIETTK